MSNDALDRAQQVEWEPGKPGSMEVSPCCLQYVWQALGNRAITVLVGSALNQAADDICVQLCGETVVRVFGVSKCS